MSAATIQAVGMAGQLLFLAAISATVSQLTLSPVYGSIPASIHHRRVTMAAALLAWTATNHRIRRYLPENIPNFIPLLAFSIPTLQFFLFQWSGQAGAVYGPLITELLTYVPLIFLSVYSAAILLESIDLSHYGETIEIAGPSLASYTLFSAIQAFSMSFIRQNIGASPILRRSVLQFVIATSYALLLPSKLLVVSVLPLLHSASLNVHISLQQTNLVLNATLLRHNYSLVERQESLTGYISVLDNLKDGFRVMRCDHSLLGGEWTLSPKGYVPRVKEPIYSVFAMLEAVRLVETESTKNKLTVEDSQRNALVIGLGIGTTPSALIAHGIDTTIVEIDPVVHDFATRYFSLPKNHTAIIEDAMNFVSRAQDVGPEHYSYDYIIHDVFTGGVEPVELFTQEFLQGLSALLEPDGVIAINYGGDVSLPSAYLVFRTVLSVFPSCRIFRESAAPSFPRQASDTAPRTKDFTNVVLFCIKTPRKFTFRDVTEADCLGSQARRYHMYPQHEINAGQFEGLGEASGKLLKKGQTQDLDKWQKETAVGHWGVMRGVLPDVVWENW